MIIIWKLQVDLTNPPVETFGEEATKDLEDLENWNAINLHRSFHS